MTDAVLDRLFRRADLTRALEEHFGSCRTWSLRMQAASSQLETLKDLMGSAAYSTFMQCAGRAVDRKETAESQLLTMHRDYLDRELYKHYGRELSETIKVAWAVTFAITLLLNDQEYAHTIKAAVQADQDSTVSPSPA
ncbi:hypothetical protein AB0G54_41500 [Streptomyces yokosukanensis]|uniref:hypothetical protein n=1 Tax=Streptomyces yokosukanensis TaxID=67386 RepID=UPI00341A13BE